MPEFLQVEDFGILGLFRAKRGVSARAAATGNEIGALYRFRQGKKLLRRRLCLVDQFLRDAVIADDRKAIFGKGTAQFIRDIFQWLVQ